MMRTVGVLAVCALACGTQPVVQDAGSTCPATADSATWGPGTPHEQPIEAAQTWTAAASPHRVKWSLLVTSPLTIEPCAVVLMEPPSGATASLTVNGDGRLVAEGTAAQPILIRGLPRADDGKRVGNTINAVTSKGEAIRLAYVTIEGSGETAASLGDYMVTLQGSGTSTPKTIHVDHVTLRDGYGGGIYLSETDRFSANSSDLAVTGMRATGGLSPDTNMPREAPVHFVSAEAVRTLPSGSYSGNASDHIAVGSFNSGGARITESGSWKDPGVPYFMRSGLKIVPSASNPTLTLEAGVTLKWTTGASLSNRGAIEVGYAATGNERATLLVAGTATKPVTMEGVTDQPGAWAGIEIHLAGSDSRLSHALLRHSGLESSTAIIDCSGLGRRFAIGVNYAARLGEPDSSIIRDTTIRDAKAGTVGIMRGWTSTGSMSTDFLNSGGNTVMGLTCRQSGFMSDPPNAPAMCSTTCD